MKGMQALIDLGFNVQYKKIRPTSEDEPRPYIAHKGAEVQIHYDSWGNKGGYDFDIFDCDFERGIGNYKVDQLLKEASLEPPNKVHKPDQKRIMKWLDYVAEKYRILSEYKAKREPERQKEIAAAMKLCERAKEKGHYVSIDNKHSGANSPLKSIKIHSEMFELTIDFSDFNYTSETLEMRYRSFSNGKRFASASEAFEFFSDNGC